MIRNQLHSCRLAQHALRISEPDQSIPFYTSKLGFTLYNKHCDGDDTYYSLRYEKQSQSGSDASPDIPSEENACLLTLVHRPSKPPADIRKQPDFSEGYWKIALAVKDVDIARTCLVENGVDVDSPRQIPDVAYLCHFFDPDGYCIELIQHDFADKHKAGQINPNHALGTEPVFSLITLRAANIEQSQRFYAKLFGMRLLSRQAIPSRAFTLYFFAFTHDLPPNADIDHIENREWLWRRPYTILELQHIWGTEKDPDFEYRTDAESGFEGMSIACKDFDDLLSKAAAMGFSHIKSDNDPVTGARTVSIVDPDGYRIQVLDTSTY